jgi:hypothetical protein
MGNGTFVGLDVHARSVVAGVIDEGTGEVRAVRAPRATEDLVGWLGTLVGPVRAAYEAGPTGYGLAAMPARLRARASRVWWLPRAGSRGPRVSGLRTIAVTPNVWPGCCGPGSWLRWRSRRWQMRVPVIWCGPVRMRAPT